MEKDEPAAGVGGKPDPVARGGQPAHVEQPRADEGVRGRAVDQRRVDLAQAGALAVGQVDRVAEQRAGAQETARS
jgi:hypothetical protein